MNQKKSYRSITGYLKDFDPDHISKVNSIVGGKKDITYNLSRSNAFLGGRKIGKKQHRLL